MFLRKKINTRSLLFACCFFLLIALTQAYLPLPKSFQDKVSQTLSEQLNAPFRAESISYRFPFSLYFKNISIGHDTKDICTAKETEISFGSSQLFSRGIILKQAYIKGLSLPDATSLETSSEAPLSSFPNPAAILSLDFPVQIENINISFENNSPDLLIKSLSLGRNQALIARLKRPLTEETLSLTARLQKGKARINVGYSFPFLNSFLSFNLKIDHSQQALSKLFKDPQHFFISASGSYSIDKLALFGQTKRLTRGKFSPAEDRPQALLFQSNNKFPIKLDGLTYLDKEQNIQSTLSYQIDHKHLDIPFLIIDPEPLAGKLQGQSGKQAKLELSLSQNTQNPFSLFIRADEKEQNLTLTNILTESFNFSKLHFSKNAQDILFDISGTLTTLELEQLFDSPALEISGTFTNPSLHHPFSIQQLKGNAFGQAFSCNSNIAFDPQHHKLKSSGFKLDFEKGALFVSPFLVNLNNPSFFGELQFDQLAILRRAKGHAETLSGFLKFNGDNARFTDFTVQTQTKSDKHPSFANLSGKLLFQTESRDFSYNLALQLSNFYLKEPELLEGYLSGNVNLSNIANYHLINGKISLAQGFLSLEELSASKSSFADLKINYLQPVKKSLLTQLAQASSGSTGLNLKVKVKDLNVDGLGFKSHWKGDLHLLGSLDKPQALGNLKAKEGRFYLGSKQLNLSRAELDFQRTPFYQGKLDLLLTSLSSQEEIPPIAISGPLNHLELSILSSSGISQGFSQLLSSHHTQNKHALFDNNANNGLTTGDLITLSQLLLRFSDDHSTLSFFSKLPSKLVDTFEIRNNDATPSDDGDLSVRLGKHLNRTIFLSLDKNLSKDDINVQLDMKLTPHLHLEAKSKNLDDVSQLSLKWRHRY